MLKLAPVRDAWQNLLEQLKERRCRVCLAPMSVKQVPAETPEARICGICANCLAGFPWRAGPVCPMCGEPLPLAELCPHCRISPKPWGRAYFLAAYSGTLRDLVRRIKFNGQLSLAEALGMLLAVRSGLAEKRADYDRIAPIPLHQRRQGKRGFNQALEISRPLAAATGIPLSFTGLLRVEDTRPQSGLTRKKRAENLCQAFAADDSWHNLRILLVDDVLTTGATLHAAASALLRAGALSVDVAALARTPARNMAAALY
ncbi:MAG: ComF family protein [Desulfovibrionaceae bacterium]|nr:ComF family protein [Desulfovibrionaceae bacterium]